MLCDYCQEEFTPQNKRRRQKYCSPECRLTAQAGANHRLFEEDRVIKEDNTLGHIRW